MTSLHPTWTGQTIGGRYKIESLLGRGGMSSVYKAMDPNLRRVVAVKIIHPHLSSEKEFVRRFESEASVVAQLRHPGILQVYDFSHDGDTYFIVFEFIPGETLEQRLHRLEETNRQMALEEMVNYSQGIAGALQYAHEREIVHRDVKPANVMLNIQGEAILMDFGIVKILGGTQHTATGALVGTARYMAPEQIKGQKVDARTDIYAFGVMMYEMLSGKLPFNAESAMTLMMMHINDPVPDIEHIRAGVPQSLVRVVERSLAKNPAQRYQTMTELLADLQAVSVALKGGTAAIAPPPPPADLTALDLEDLAGGGLVTELLPEQPSAPPPLAIPRTEMIAGPTNPPVRQTTASQRQKAPAPQPQPQPRQTAAPLPQPAPAAGGGGIKKYLPFLLIGGFLLIALLGIGAYFIFFADGDNGGNSGVAVTDNEEETAVPDEDSEDNPPPDEDEDGAIEEGVLPTEAPSSTPEAKATSTTAPTLPPEPTATPTETPVPVPPGMILIPGGTFLLGANNGEANEQPEHAVTLDSYFIDQFEVDNASYAACVNAGVCTRGFANSFRVAGYRDSPDFANHPVMGVTWVQADAYCRFAGKRLPTEAEWEFAASGPDNFIWPWGNSFDPALTAATTPDTVRVDSFPAGASPFGVFNMAGNVNEWVLDTFTSDFYTNSPGANPVNLAEGNQRIYRGGSFDNTNGIYYTTSRRYVQSTTFTDVDIGFRCGADLP